MAVNFKAFLTQSVCRVPWFPAMGKYPAARTLHTSLVLLEARDRPRKEQPATPHCPDFHSKPFNRNTQRDVVSLMNYRYAYPEFLPDSNADYRHPVREKLERLDMLKRRRVLEIPEFYVGSVLAVTASDQFAPGKVNRFLGICILRAENGMRTSFTLRNVIDHQGVEICYDLYNPCIQKIEVLRLEKRLDEQLMYLRDADPEHSTFPFDMEAEHHPENAPIPVNTTKVKLKPPPWFARWELWNLQGVEQYLDLPEWRIKNKEKHDRPWLKWDLMGEYRKSIHEEDQMTIWTEVESHHKEMKIVRKTDRRKHLQQETFSKKL